MTDIIFDGNSLAARSFFAASKDRPDPVGALRSALISVLSILDLNSDKLGVPVDRILFCWDGENKVDKQRAPKPTEYHEVLPYIRQALTTMLSCAHASSDKFEGDDAVATAVFRNRNESVYVVSGDKDLVQLAGNRVRYYSLNEKAVLNHPFISGKWHIKHPNQIGIALAITGDKIDNVPGIKGWGPKKVKKLFTEVTPEMSFEEALAAVEAQIPEDKKPVFYQSLEMVLLNPNVPGVPEPAQLVWGEMEEMAALDLPDFLPFYERVVGSYYAWGRDQ